MLKCLERLRLLIAERPWLNPADGDLLLSSVHKEDLASCYARQTQVSGLIITFC